MKIAFRVGGDIADQDRDAGFSCAFDPRTSESQPSPLKDNRRLVLRTSGAHNMKYCAKSKTQLYI